MYKSKKIEKLVGVGVLSAIVIILQLLSTFGIHIGVVPITLVLVPIAIGAILYGPLAGAFLGGVFGIVVIIMTLVGLDPVAMTMMQFNMVAAVSTIMLKGIFAGLICGLIYKMFYKMKRGKIGAIVGTFLCPVINTSIYMFMSVFVFRELMEKNFNTKGVISIFLALFGVILVNFISEIVVTVVLTPIVLHIIKIAIKIKGEI